MPFSLNAFEDALVVANDNRPLDDDQLAAIRHPASEPLIIVASAGTGKTTTLAGRALRMVFVDGIDPGAIVLTTFTKKAAGELRSRTLGWAAVVRDALALRADITPEERHFLERLDTNRFITGTLDSISQGWLTDFRPVGENPPVVFDQFLSDAVLLQQGLFNGRLDQDPDLIAFVAQHTFGDDNPSVRHVVRVCREYADRIRHDLLDRAAFAASGAGPQVMDRVFDQYLDGLAARGPDVVDFAGLEGRLLDRIENGSLADLLAGLRAVIVDEYQDTNALQEAIYHSLARAVGGALTFVGDDDQSLFRFRGATVELFRDAEGRLQEALGLSDPPQVVHLRVNYRSHRPIVDMSQDYVSLDARFQPSRLSNKPRAIPVSNAEGTPPIVAMFRDTQAQLAADLGELVRDFLLRGGLVIPTADGPIHVTPPADSQPGDVAYIGFSVNEVQRANRFTTARDAFPGLLRQALEAGPEPIQVFNPRGEVLAFVPVIEQLCGLMLVCLDPQGAIQDGIQTLPNEVRDIFNTWRATAQSLIQSDPEPNTPTTLAAYVASWAMRAPQLPNEQWPRYFPLIDLCYQLVTWIPELLREPEHQLHLEVVARAIAQATAVATYRGQFLGETDDLARRSVTDAIRNIFVPLALGDIAQNEDIVESMPRSAVNFLTIHQAKGLEYPLVIVDVGSRFRVNQPTTRWMRFPDDGGETHLIEDITQPFGRLAGVPLRTPRDRAFDDLQRLFYVAFTRAQGLLVLAGLTNVDPGRPRSPVPHVAVGWDRGRTAAWRNAPPYIRI